MEIKIVLYSWRR